MAIRSGVGFVRVGVVAALLATLGPASASANISGGFSWQPPVSVDPSTHIEAIDCPSSSLCVAADRSGDVVTSTDPAGGATAWSAAHIDNSECQAYPAAEPCSLGPISCPSTSFCALTGQEGDVFTSTDPTGGPAAWGSTPVEAWALSCPSESLCVAVNQHGDAITSTDPAAAAPTWHSALIDSGPCPIEACYSIDKGPPERQVGAISCASESLCVAGDWDGNVLVSTDPTGGGGGAWSSAYIDSNLVADGPAIPEIQTRIGPISCPSVSMCVAADDVGDILVSQNPTGGASTWRLSRATRRITVEGAHGLYSLRCPSVSFCAGLNSNPYTTPRNSEAALTYDPLAGREWTQVVIDSVASLDSISCPSESLCVAVDKAGNVVVGQPPSRAQIRALMAAEIGPPAAARLPARPARHGSYSLAAFNPPRPGGVRIRWLLPRPHFKPLVVARGQQHFPEAETAPVTLTLTGAGLAALRAHRRVRLTAEAVFTRFGGRSVMATTTFTLRR